MQWPCCRWERGRETLISYTFTAEDASSYGNVDGATNAWVNSQGSAIGGTVSFFGRKARVIAEMPMAARLILLPAVGQHLLSNLWWHYSYFPNSESHNPRKGGFNVWSLLGSTDNDRFGPNFESCIVLYCLFCKSRMFFLISAQKQANFALL